MSELFQQAIIPVADPATFAVVASAIESIYTPRGVEAYLRSLQKSSIRIRDFEHALRAGKLGKDASAAYANLNDSDQGMIRELYLASLEKVSLDLRDKYFKIYAYY